MNPGIFIQFVEIFVKLHVIIALQDGKKQGFPETAGTNKKQIIADIFDRLQVHGFVYIVTITLHDSFVI